MTETFNAIMASAIDNHLTLDFIRAVSNMQGASLEQTREGLTNYLNGRKVTVAGQALFIPRSKMVRWTRFAIHLFKCISSNYRLQFQKATDCIYSLISDSQQLPTLNKNKYLNINFIERCFCQALKQSQKNHEQTLELDRGLAQNAFQAEIDRKTTADMTIAVKLKELTAQLETATIQKSELQRSISALREQIQKNYEQSMQTKIAEGFAVTEDSLKKKKMLVRAYETYSSQLSRTKENIREISQFKTNVTTIVALQKAIHDLESQFVTEFGKDSIRKERVYKVGLGAIGKPFELIGVKEKISGYESHLNSQKKMLQRQQVLEQQLAEEEKRLQDIDIKIAAIEKSLEILPKHLSQPEEALQICLNGAAQREVDRKKTVIAQTMTVNVDASPKLKPQEAMLQELQKRGLTRLAAVFEAIFAKCPDVVQTWTVKGNNDFSLQLKQSIQLWIPSEENPGGVVIQIGVNEKKTMNGKFVDTTHPNSKQLDGPTEDVIRNALKDPANAAHKGLSRERMSPKGMKLETGFYFCCHTNNRLMGISDKIQVSYLLELGGPKLLFIAGMLGVNQGRIRDAQNYQQQLYAKGKPLLGNVSAINFIKSSPRGVN
jgi:hypothetical protein